MGETEYGIKGIPLGGYIRMIGMFPPRRDGSRRSDESGRWALIAEQARQDAQREVSPRDADRLFYQRPVPQRIVIMLGGPVMNLVVAVVLLAIVVCGFGVPTSVPRVAVRQQLRPRPAEADGHQLSGRRRAVPRQGRRPEGRGPDRAVRGPAGQRLGAGAASDPCEHR